MKKYMFFGITMLLPLCGLRAQVVTDSLVQVPWWFCPVIPLKLSRPIRFPPNPKIPWLQIPCVVGHRAPRCPR